MDTQLLSEARTRAAYLIFLGSFGLFIIVGGADRAGLTRRFLGAMEVWEGVDLTFREYLRAGVPITLATLAVESTWLWLRP